MLSKEMIITLNALRPRYKVVLRGEPNKQLLMDTPFAVAGLIQSNLLLLDEQADHPILDVEKTYDYSTRTQLQSLTSALHSGASIHLTIRAKFSPEPLPYDVKPFFIVSSHDVSGLVPTIRAKLSFNNIASNTVTATNETSRRCIKRGCIPVCLYLGSYHNTSDIKEIDQMSTSLARGVAAGIYQFLSSGLFIPKQQRAPKAPAPDACVVSLFHDCYTTAWSATDADRGIFNSAVVATITGGQDVEYIRR